MIIGNIKQRVIIVFVFLFLITSCLFVSHRVNYYDMMKAPYITIHGDKLTLHTRNSKINSARLIYKVDIVVDTDAKSVLFYGWERSMKPYKDAFEFDIDGKVASNIRAFRFYWIDPDNSRHDIQIR